MDFVDSALVIALAATRTSLAAEQVGVRVPPTVVIETEERYTLMADNLSELKRQVQQDGRHAESRNSNGLTRSQIEVSYEFETRRQSCRLMLAELTLHITTILPDWKPRKKVSAEAKQRWEESLAALARHEAVHAQHAREAAEEIRLGLSSLGPKPRCKDIEWQAQRNLQRAIFRLDLKGQRFDMRTDFGLRDNGVP